MRLSSPISILSQPRKAGIQGSRRPGGRARGRLWTPAFAGGTGRALILCAPFEPDTKLGSQARGLGEPVRHHTRRAKSLPAGEPRSAAMVRRSKRARGDEVERQAVATNPGALTAGMRSAACDVARSLRKFHGEVG